MNKDDVIALLGEPDRILPRGTGMVSRAWSCSTCRKLHQFPEPVGPPAREEFSCIQIAEKFGLTRQRVHQILNEAPIDGGAQPQSAERG